MVSGGMTCVKYLLFCFNLLLAISGIAIVTAGAIIHFAYTPYQNFFSASYQTVPIILIVVGVVIFMVAFFGCCGVVKENHCMVVTFSILLLIIFTMELAAGIVGYIRGNEVKTMLENKLNSTMYDYYKNEKLRETWDLAQHEAECCGMNGVNDWKLVNHNDSLPHTCCPNAQNDGSCTVRSPNKYTSSCFQKLKDNVVRYGSVIGAIGVGVAVSQLIGILFACCLARSIREEYETV